MNAHPASEIFPKMGHDELHALADDIKQHGLLEPILTLDGAILDGRNRFAACNLAGVEPQFSEWKLNGESPTLFVISKNLHRRHLTTAQRAAIGVEMLPLLEEEAKKRQVELAGTRHRGDDLRVNLHEGRGRATSVAAKAVGVGESSVGRARAVKTEDPAAFERLKKGESTVNAEFVKVTDAKPRQRPSVATGKREQARDREREG